jgi:DNA-binding transcriptional ArsR family regulator
MSDPITPSTSPLLPLDSLCLLVSDSTRWRVIRELAKGEALPVGELGRRLDRTSSAMSKHLAVMSRLGVIQAGFGRLYSLAPAYRPAGGSIDFGHCVMRLDTPLE